MERKELKESYELAKTYEGLRRDLYTAEWGGQAGYDEWYNLVKGNNNE